MGTNTKTNEYDSRILNSLLERCKYSSNKIEEEWFDIDVSDLEDKKEDAFILLDVMVRE
jgi:hypothetical protein